ncbi:MAG: hypothetical protein IKQ25_07090 [Lachnospiraceae bacterium]|nr:hypothetical protein [Lachnospiraceae bacterium]
MTFCRTQDERKEDERKHEAEAKRRRSDVLSNAGREKARSRSKAKAE